MHSKVSANLSVYGEVDFILKIKSDNVFGILRSSSSSSLIIAFGNFELRTFYYCA